MWRGTRASFSAGTNVRLPVHFCQWCVGFDTMFLRIPLMSHDGTLALQKKFMLLA
jgi:hypothetical protein